MDKCNAGFAIMRNAHEAFRQGIKEMSSFLANQKFDEFATAWERFSLATKVNSSK